MAPGAEGLGKRAWKQVPVGPGELPRSPPSWGPGLLSEQGLSNLFLSLSVPVPLRLSGPSTLCSSLSLPPRAPSLCVSRALRSCTL